MGVTFGCRDVPAASRRLRAPRIGLWDQYGGSIESGWTRWILEQFEFQFARVYAPQLDAGELNAKYDVLIFPNGAIPARGWRTRRPRRRRRPESRRAAEYREQVGRVTADRTIPQIRRLFRKAAQSSPSATAAANLADAVQLPIENHLVENGNRCRASKFFVPGSVLTAQVDERSSRRRECASTTDFFFDNSPVFRLGDDAAAAGVGAIATFDTRRRSAAAGRGVRQYLKGGVIAVGRERWARGVCCCSAPRSCSAHNPMARSSCSSTACI